MVPHLLPPSFTGGDRSRRTHFRIATWRRKRRRIASLRSIVSAKRKGHCLHHRRFIHPDWSNIHFDVLERAQKKFPFADTLQCRAVCSRWRSLTQTHISSSLYSPPPAAHLPPLILRPDRPQFLDHPAMHPAKDLYPLSRKEKTLLDRERSHCVGYSHGWFLFLHTSKKDRLCLFHPWLFYGATVCFSPILTPKGFPPILTLTQYCDWSEIAEKVVFWADPILSNGNYGIALIHPCYNRVLFAKSGANKFTDLEYLDVQTREATYWTDIICFHNCIYAVGLTEDEKLDMAAWECSRQYDIPVKVLEDFHTELISANEISSFYLVESQGELLLVSIRGPDMRRMLDLHYRRHLGYRELFVHARSPKTIRVYKMDFSQMKWVQMDSLGDRVLFIMGHQNVSVSSLEFPQYKGNTIYFKHEMDIGSLWRCCIGVFNMEDGSMQEIWPEKLE